MNHLQGGRLGNFHPLPKLFYRERQRGVNVVDLFFQFHPSCVVILGPLPCLRRGMRYSPGLMAIARWRAIRFSRGSGVDSIEPN